MFSNIKKPILAFVFLIAGACLVSVGCDIDETTALAITRTSGMLAVTTWVAYDNPAQEVKTAMTNVVDQIVEASEQIQSGETYIDVVYPQIVLYVDQSTKIESQYKPLIKSGSIVILTAIDELFASNPDMQKNRDVARKYVQAFCGGVESGLLLNEASPTMQRAAKAYSLRMQLAAPEK